MPRFALVSLPGERAWLFTDPLAPHRASIPLDELAWRYSEYLDEYPDSATYLAPIVLLAAPNVPMPSMRFSLPVAPPSSNLPFQASLFENFSRDDIEFVLPVLAPVSFGRGAVIYREGDPGDEMLLIIEGSASAVLDAPHGAMLRLATFGPGTVLGEMSIVDETEGLRRLWPTTTSRVSC
jgi:hypothetical protein